MFIVTNAKRHVTRKSKCLKLLVLFLAKSNVAEDEVLNTVENYNYMKSAADWIGAAAALSKPRAVLIRSKEQQAKEDDAESDSEDSEASISAVKKYFSKYKGGDLQSPPPMSSRQSTLTFFGTLLTLLVLGFLSEVIQDATSDQYHIVLGPFGALVSKLHDVCILL